MIISAEWMRFFLVVCMVGMAILAGIFLRGRNLSFLEYFAWGLLALLVPLLGPFLVILVRPGEPSLRAR
jgi:hypothetical protein